MLRLFLWKNGKHIIFHWVSITLTLLGSIIALFIYLSTTNLVNIYEQNIAEPQNEGNLKTYFAGGEHDFIYYAPTNPTIDKLIEDVRIDLSVSAERVLPFNNAEDMFLAIEEENNENNYAILFRNATENEDNLDYAISSTSNHASTSMTFWNDENVVGIKELDDYTQSGFFTLQQVIDKNFIKNQIKREPNSEIELAPLPNRELTVLDSSRVISFGVLYSLLLSFLLLITFLVPLVEEKQNGIKEFLNLTTPFSFLNGITFYVIRSSIYWIFSLFAIIFGYFYNGTGIIPIHFVIILFILFIHSTMCYTMLVSVCFNSVFYAKAAGSLLLFVPCVLFFAEGSILQHYPYFFSETTFLEGMRILQIFTNKHKVLTWTDLSINITPTSCKLGEVYEALLIQCVVYSALYWYFSFIFPGPDGISQPFYFFLMPSFYKSSFITSSTFMDKPSSNSHSEKDAVLEIRNLTKEINKCCGNKIIVQNLKMDIIDKRITVLLGHNGAGKTTTINMIIGAIDKTSGEISVCGLKDPSQYRHLIGYCPQYSIFMEYLNCFEHLKFFAQLRGKSDYEAEKAANLFLDKLHLKDKAKEPGRNLSGGMKRRLSLGMAVIGETKLIILDEPSSGLDPESRRQLWDVLLKLRKSQAILLTTHFMEEAEVLGDNVTILSHGKLVCEGTPMDLKRKFKCGYILKLLIDERNFDKNKTLNIIKQQIPDAKEKAYIKPTLCITLPYEQQSKYVNVLKYLENNSQMLGIQSISVTNSTLEDVFLNCTSHDEVDTFYNKNHFYGNLKPDDVGSGIISPSSPPKITQQSFAVFYKKLIFLKRLWLYSLFMFLLPFAAITLSYFIIDSQRLHFTSTNELQLNLHHLPKSRIFIKISPEVNEVRQYFVNVVNKTKNVELHFLAAHHTLEDEMLKIQQENLADFYQHVMGAIEAFEADGRIHMKILFSTNIIHSSSIMLNLVDNVLLKYFTKNDDIQIQTSNIPVKRAAEISPAKLEYYAYIVPVGWFFYIVFYISLPFEEDKSEFKKLQNIPPLVYWTSFTFYDVLLHCIICWLTYAFHKILPFHEVYNDDELVLLTLTFMLYGFAYLPILYICASSFKSLSTLTAFLFSFFIISTIIPDVTSANRAAMEEYSGVIYILLCLPDFAIKHQIKVINENYFLNRRNALLSYRKIGQNEDFIKLNITGKQEETISIIEFYIYSIIIMIICEIFLIFIWENLSIRQKIFDFIQFKCFCRRNNRTIESSNQLNNDDDVQREKDEVDSILDPKNSISLTDSNYHLIVSNLQKSYGSLLAVNQISFAVKQGECFGLLGLNGAGKTSTFEMITGNMKINNGNVIIDRVSVDQNINLYKSSLGYCPQGNALISHMTAFEILKYIAMIRGIRNPHNEVIKWLEHLDLLRYKDVPVCDYSGGTKRKLNTAIAMIGNPKVLFLDEPTAGVDPKSRRFIWKCIQQFQRNNKTIVLTSHSMDECENLCNRLAIMAEGRFQCIGYIPVLKTNFGSGFTITFRVKENVNEQIVKQFEIDMKYQFTCNLREKFAGVMTYFVNEKTVQWSAVFFKLEQLFDKYKDTFLIDYSVSEATLEDIFLKFESKFRNIETSLV